MKKIISLILCLLLTATVFTGCNLIEHNYERDYAQVIVTIGASQPKEYTEQRIKLGTNGLPIYDVDGEIETEKVVRTFSAPETKIYKSQLVNYVNYYLGQELNSGGKVETSIDKFINTLVSTELLMREANRLFDARVLYWTKDDVEEIQRSVYTSISDEIFTRKNELLKAAQLPELPEKGGDPSTGETTYPIKPEENAEAVISPAYLCEDTGLHEWFDSWYLNDEWYITQTAYKNSYPGLYGTPRDKSLASQAFSLYIDFLIDNSDSIIGLTDGEKDIIAEEVKEIEAIRRTEGVEYVYPMLGKTFLAKLLIGNSLIKNKKLTKLEEHITKGKTKVTEEDVTVYYNDLLAKQKINFATQSNYDSAVSGDQTILYTPSDRYVFVKHILLPFSAEQTAELERIKKENGASNSNISDERKELIEARRAALARQIIVYPHVNGENDLANGRTVKQVTAEITFEMNRLKNNAKEAERKFDDFIYMYNTDPGIFSKEKGYAVVYKLNEGENETYMTEFANAARAFRDGDYEVGQIYYDEEMTDENGKPLPYIITDYGIHIMYYCLDPVAGHEMPLSGYVTPGRYNRIYDLMETATIDQIKSYAYTNWESRHINDNKALYAETEQKIVDKYIKELNKLIYG